GGETMAKDRLHEVFSPWVFRAALRKVEYMYQQGEWYDPAEWLDWQHRPWENLSTLAHELLNGSYEPGPFPLVPYPKKGQRTRHYCVPPVKDQVAFMVFMVLLGPFYEARMENVSFGNRLYRRRYLSDEPSVSQRERPKQAYWAHAPFSLHDR